MSHKGYKSKNAFKFQTLMAKDELILHWAEPLEGRRHEFSLYVALYVQSNIEQKLEDVCFVDGTQYYLHTDSRYNRRLDVDVPFQGANLPPAQTSVNE